MDYQSGSQDPTLSLDERLKILYPHVDQEATPLPKCWSTKDKYNYIGLSQNNLRVHYKGHGKGHKDASSVRATHPVPASCGLYYYEIRVVSKGKDGYMGVGLCASDVNMNRLPGWDKHSYGYHGDDGHSFCSSGQGQKYGPTFTTGDVIGCGINLMDGTCFYTKNGHNLGIAFRDLSPNLFPTVGLQTQGEVLDANFGQDPFVFDVEGEIKELQRRTQKQVVKLPWPKKYGDQQTVLQRMVSSYLVHHGYSLTAEVFSTCTGESITEELSSMKNRQHIQRLVLGGRIGEAISTTMQIYPGLLRNNVDLLFRLKVRQFIEMLAGADSLELESKTESTGVIAGGEMEVEARNTDNSNENLSNGNDIKNSNGNCESANDSMELDGDQRMSEPILADSKEEDSSSTSILNNPAKFEALIKFGRGLQELSQQVELDRVTELHEAFSLLAYADPWNSPVAGQLDPARRESVCHSLNSAILESKNLPGRPPLEISVAHSRLLLNLMANKDLGACAFVDRELVH